MEVKIACRCVELHDSAIMLPLGVVSIHEQKRKSVGGLGSPHNDMEVVSFVPDYSVPSLTALGLRAGFIKTMITI